MNECPLSFDDKILYLNILKEYIDHELPVEEFEQEFWKLWNRKIDKRNNIRSSWKERHDLLLEESLRDKKISSIEFTYRWRKLWGYRSDNDWIFNSIVESLMTDVDSFCADPDERENFEIDEDELRQICKEKLAKLRAIPLED